MIRTYGESDAEAVMALNAANVPEVGPMDRDRLDHLISEAFLFDVVELDGAIEGVLVVMVDGGAYGSPNYAMPITSVTRATPSASPTSPARSRRFTKTTASSSRTRTSTV